MTRSLVVVLSAAAALAIAGRDGVAARQSSPTTAATAAEVTAAVGQLGSFDFTVRTQAARTIRRAPAATAVPPLVEAIKGHKDSYVR